MQPPLQLLDGERGPRRHPTDRLQHDGDLRAAPGVDVDAVTFSDVDYWVAFGTPTNWKRHVKGEWTRIHNDQTASCDTDGSRLRCLIF